MRTVRYCEYGGPEVLRFEDTNTPHPGLGEALVRAEAIGVNFIATQLCRNTAPLPSPLPNTPGGDVVGIVEAIGPDVTNVQIGDRVATHVGSGAYADHVVADAALLNSIPKDLDVSTASLLASPGQVGLNVLAMARIAPGDTVLVHAASGTIGQVLIQLARRQGAGKVVGTASTPTKLEVVRAQGAEIAIDYSSPFWAENLRQELGGSGVNVVLDSVGGDVVAPSLDLLEPFGRLVFYGSAQKGADVASVSMMDLVMGLIYVTGVSADRLRAARPELVHQNFEILNGYAASGQLNIEVYAKFPLEQAAEVHRVIEDRKHTGRILLVP